MIGLSIRQNLDWTGGTFYIDSQLDFMRNFGDTKSTQYSSVPIRVGYQQSLLGYNAFRWDRKIEPLKYEKVKKQFIYNTETVSEEAVTYFFALAMAQADYQLAKENVSSSDTLYSIGLQRHKIAAISRADLLTLELDKVNAHNTLENAQIALKRAMFSLASFLNLDKNTTIELSLPGRPAAMEIPVDVALAKAKENNPSFLEQRQNILEAEQNVNNQGKGFGFLAQDGEGGAVGVGLCQLCQLVPDEIAGEEHLGEENQGRAPGGGGLHGAQGPVQVALLVIGQGGGLDDAGGKGGHKSISFQVVWVEKRRAGDAARLLVETEISR